MSNIIKTEPFLPNLKIDKEKIQNTYNNHYEFHIHYHTNELPVKSEVQYEKIPTKQESRRMTAITPHDYSYKGLPPLCSINGCYEKAISKYYSPDLDVYHGFVYSCGGHGGHGLVGRRKYKRTFLGDILDMFM